MEYGVFECGCVATKSIDGMRIDYCPKHEAALDMYEALKEIYKRGYSKSIIPQDDNGQLALIAVKALAKVEGK